MADGRPFTPEDDQVILAAYAARKGQRGWAMDAAKVLNRRPDTIANRRRLVLNRPPAEPVPETNPAETWAAMRDADERKAKADAEHFAELTDKFRPVDLPPLDRPRLTYKPNPCWVISSDHHWPCQDERVESIILQAIEVLRPTGYILDGDGPDMLALSQYPKDARRGHTWELRDEQHAAKSWWRSVGSLMRRWNGTLYETEANHSGNDTASRWRRWLNQNASILFQLDGAEDALDYRRYFHHPDVPVSLVNEVVIADDLRVRHGEMVRKHGAYSARAHGDKWQSSVLHGHTHRIGSSIKRRPGIPGVRPDEWLRTYEIGCACRMDPDYCPGADWANGFAVVHVDPSQPLGYGVELIQIINGRATSTTLRGTLAA